MFTYRLFGAPISQPTRAVRALAAAANVPMPLTLVSPVVGETVTPEFLQRNPLGYVPVLEVTPTGASPFHVCEGSSILQFLAEAERLVDVYPPASPATLETRAAIHSWMSWHHHASRRMTSDLFRRFMVDFRRERGLDVNVTDPRLHGRYDVQLTPEFVDTFFSSVLPMVLNEMDAFAGWNARPSGSSPFLVLSDKSPATPSLADYYIFAEFDQLIGMGAISSAAEKTRRPGFARWLDAMWNLPEQAVVREPCEGLWAWSAQRLKTLKK
jgi:glutathione S-transferase